MRRREGGIALIELVVFVVPAFAVLLAYSVFYGRMLYNYEIAHKAANSAARYLSSAAAVNMGSTSLAGNEVAVAKAIALEGLQDLQPGADMGPFVIVRCNGSECIGTSLPATVSVQVQFFAHNGLYGDFVPDMGDRLLQATSTMRYVGN